MKRSLFALVVGLLMIAVPARAQITVPNTLTAGQVIRAAELNTNFSTLGTKALNRISGGEIEGNITLLNNITIDGVDISDFLLTTGEVRAQTAGTAAAPSFSRTGETSSGMFFPNLGEIGFSLSGTSRMTLTASGLTVFGTNIINSAGKIPELSSTYLASLSGANLTGLNASNLSSGTVADGRLSANVALRDAANTFTVSGAAITHTPSVAPAADTKLVNLTDAAAASKFSVDYEGDVIGNSITLSSATGFKLGTSTTSGYVLTADASGNGTWQSPGVSTGAVPSGMIAMFDTACPSTWTRVSAWDNKFVRGGATYSATGGGSDTHTHTVDPASTASTSAGAHSHTINAGGDHTHSVDVAITTSSSSGNHGHDLSGSTAGEGGHSHTGTTDNGGDHTHTIAANVSAAEAGASTGTIPPGSTDSGGSHNHTFSTSSVANHSHSLLGGVADVEGAHTHTVDPLAVTSGSGGSHSHTESAAVDHSHSVDIASTATSSGANVPAYVQVVFCKKD